MRWALAIVVAAGALGLTACMDTSQNAGRVALVNTVAPLGPVAPPTTPPRSIPAGAQQFIDSFVFMLDPGAIRVYVCPGLRSEPAQSRQSIRRSFDIAPVHEAAARFGYSNDEFVDMIMSAYSKRLEAVC